MHNSMTRKDFLSSFFRHFREEYRNGSDTAFANPVNNKNAFLLPPGALSPDNYVSRCTQCYDCVSVCPHEALRVNRKPGSEMYGFPFIEPGQQPCYRCTDFPCATACQEGALDIDRAPLSPGFAVIEESRCLAFAGHFCRSCITNCPESGSAIYADENGYPVVARDLCTGCGQCVFSCASEISAIRVVPLAEAKKEA